MRRWSVAKWVGTSGAALFYALGRGAESFQKTFAVPAKIV